MSTDSNAVRFRCPHCGEALTDDATGARCINRHQFDRAREGYLNLLVGGRLKGKPAGDTDDMVKARRRFFVAGHYAPIQQAVAELCSSAERVLDAGCGEGAYLAAATEASGGHGWGIDVSKPAIKAAAKRYRQHRYAVASSYRLPFDNAQFDAVLSVFAPRPWAELRRVVRPGGCLVVVSPGPDHLDGLTSRLYGAPRQHEADDHADESSSFAPERVERVRFDLHLDGAAAMDLLAMTPYWWSVNDEQRAHVAAASLRTTVDMLITVERVNR
jgi:23S rRNA (guanine745-N1)-methyltransferase